MSSGSRAARPSNRKRLVVYIEAEVVISEMRVIWSLLASSCFIHSSMLTCFSSLADLIDHASRTRRARVSSPTASSPARSAVISDWRDHAISGISTAPSSNFMGLIACNTPLESIPCGPASPVRKRVTDFQRAWPARQCPISRASTKSSSSFWKLLRMAVPSTINALVSEPNV